MLQTTLAAVGLTSLMLYIILLLVKSCFASRYVGHGQPTARIGAGVTVLQPILSGDSALADVLQSNVDSCGKAVRFVWLIDESDEQALALCSRLQESAGNRIEVVVCPPCPPDCNPKSFKLSRGLARTKTEFVAVLDDDTRISDQNLNDAVGWLADYDLYTGLPCYLHTGSIWSKVVASFVNSNASMTYLMWAGLSAPLTINGMFYVMSAEKLRKIDGFESIVLQLCDDYAMARLIRGQGMRIRQGWISQRLQTTVESGRAYVGLLHRWFVFANVLVADQPARTKATLFILLGLPPLLLWASFLSLAVGWLGILALVAMLVIRHLTLALWLAKTSRRVTRLSPVLSVAAEMLQPLHWLHASMSRTIRWRTRTIRVIGDGSIRYLASAGELRRAQRSKDR